MTIDATMIYLWQLADSLRSLMGALAFVSFFAAFAVILWCAMWIEETKLKRWQVVLLLATPVVFSVLRALIPTSKTVAMMVVVPGIVESRVIKEDLPEVYDAALKALKSQLGTANREPGTDEGTR